jgi:c-di-AMP phosphodiesterase-like protein
MTKIEKPSLLEKVSGSLVTESVATALATYVGTPLAALLPVLSKALASERHRKRVEKALEDINQVLVAHEDKLRQLSDSQYKIINEVILTILQTTEQEKIEYLKTAIKNVFNMDKFTISVSTLISRILRDITLEEIVFLLKYSKYSRIIFSGQPMNDRELRINAHSKEGVIVSGLISLGLMIPGAATFDDIGRYQYSPLVNDIIKIISS